MYGTTGRGITWTETDRVRSICNGTPGGSCPTIAEARYTAGGIRTHNKVTTSGTTETLYVNQYLTVRNGTIPTKHVYLGDARVASKVETNSTNNARYWYHSDHIQSTQYVTTSATGGQSPLVQHLEFFPGGELWREENDTSRTRWPETSHATTFTGKEMDPSGYYYFGARYYEPEIQMWLSPDPILASYMRGKPNGGVFEPANLGLYSYAWNNPVVLHDPDGANVAAPALRGALWGIGRLFGIKALTEAAGTVATGTAAGGAVAAEASAVRNGQLQIDMLDPTFRFSDPIDRVFGFGRYSKEYKAAVLRSENKAAPKEIEVSQPESAQHIKDAQASGKPQELTIDRGGAAARRAEAMKGTSTTKGKDRDEYPPAMFKEGGKNASVRPISPSDNRSAGACIGAACRGLPDGTKVILKPVAKPSSK